jgi:hypothetical protein
MIRPGVLRLLPQRIEPRTVVEVQGEIDVHVRRGDSFATIEDDLIEPSGLSEQQKSALWLYAWSFVDQRAQRCEARAHLMLVGGRAT